MIPVEHLEGEVDPDGGAVMLREDLLHVALDDGRFTDSEVADDQHFEQPLVLHRSRDEVSKLEEFRTEESRDARRVWPGGVGLNSHTEANSWNAEKNCAIVPITIFFFLTG